MCSASARQRAPCLRPLVLLPLPHSDARRVAGAIWVGLTRTAPRCRRLPCPPCGEVQCRFQTIRDFTSLVVNKDNTFGGTDYRFPSNEDAGNAIGINDNGSAKGMCQPYVMDRSKYNPSNGHMDLSEGGDC